MFPALVVLFALGLLALQVIQDQRQHGLVVLQLSYSFFTNTTSLFQLLNFFLLVTQAPPSCLRLALALPSHSHHLLLRRSDLPPRLLLLLRQGLELAAGDTHLSLQGG